MMCGGMMLLLISGAISNSNAVIRQEFRKLRFQMIDDNFPKARLEAVPWTRFCRACMEALEVDSCQGSQEPVA